MSSPPPTPPGSALASPLTFGVAAAGGILGAVIGSFGGPIIAIVVAVLLAAVAVGVRVAVARPASGATRRSIDPFTLTDPWRRFVADALSAQTTFEQAVERTAEGPTQDRLVDLAARVDDAVEEIWQNARGGHELTKAARRLAPAADSAQRLSAQTAAIQQRLGAASAELTRVVGLAVEVSVSAHQLDEFASVEASVSALTDELHALRSAIAETAALGRGGAS